MESSPITPIQNESFDNILKLLPDHFKAAPGFQEYKDDLFKEVAVDFERSMKKSQGWLTLTFTFFLHCVSYVKLRTKNCLFATVQLSLVKPQVRGLEDDDAGPPPEEPSGLDYSSPWHEEFVANKDNIRNNLHILHPSMQVVLRMCQATLGTMLVVDCSTYR